MVKSIALLLSIISITSCSPSTLYSTYSFDPLRHLSGIAPYFEPQDPPRNPNPPAGCSVTRAAYLVRHAAINANDFDYENYLQPFIEKLGNTSISWKTIPQLSFLDKWFAPGLSELEQLTRTGKLEAAQLGVSISYRYQNLRLPGRVWASTAERTVESAKGLIRGLEVEDNSIKLVQVYEGKKAGADTLTPYSSCPAYSSSAGSDPEAEYLKLYTKPITARFNALAPKFNFTAKDIFAMQELCGYETVIRGTSPFCSTELFSPDEWLSFEYTNDIFYHYNSGYGNEASGAIGFPWVNKTLSILTGETAAQDIYVSFTHRELPPAVLVAMGLFNNTEFSSGSLINATMPTDRINYNRAWISSFILPFLSNIAIERMNCSESVHATQGGDETYYRVLVNQSPQTLPGCHDGPLESCSAGGLSRYLGEREALFGGFGQRCGVDYGNSTNVVAFYDT